MNEFIKWLKANKDLLVGIGLIESGWVAALVVNHLWYKRAMKIDDEWYATSMSLAKGLDRAAALILEYQSKE